MTCNLQLQQQSLQAKIVGGGCGGGKEQVQPRFETEFEPGLKPRGSGLSKSRF